VLLESGDVQGAIVRLERALQRYPNKMQLVYDYPEALIKAGRYADAAKFGEIAFNCTSGVGSIEALTAAGAENLAEAIVEQIEFEGPDTVAAVILEPVQNAGGCFVPPEGYFQRVREICDEYNCLMISDEVICSWGRLGEWFGAQRFGYQPDIITTAKGLTSAYASMGAMIASDRLMEPFLEGNTSFVHGFTFGGHPMASAIALANIQAMEDEEVIENVRENEPYLRAMLESMRDIPIVGDVRGADNAAPIVPTAAQVVRQFGDFFIGHLQHILANPCC
jgi:adenosylmethionine-8-amino-7-oxononanoate aminotransferase